MNFANPVHASDAGVPLEERFRELFPGRSFIVVSNREPYEHHWADEVGEV